MNPNPFRHIRLLALLLISSISFAQQTVSSKADGNATVITITAPTQTITVRVENAAAVAPVDAVSVEATKPVTKPVVILPELNVQPVTTGFADHKVPTRRWLGIGLMLFNQQADGSMTADDQELLTYSAQKGANYVHASLDWNRAEPATLADGQYDFRLYDDLLAKAAQNGLKVWFRIAMARSDNSNKRRSGKAFIDESEMIRDLQGRVCNDAGAYMGSFDSEPFLAKVDGFVTAAVRHIQQSPYAGVVLGFSLVTNVRQEGCYPMDNQINGAGYQTTYDFSDASLTVFRERLRAKYTTIGSLNKAWGGSYANFDQVQFPTISGEGHLISFFSNAQKDLYSHREQSIANLANRFDKTVKAVSKNLYTATEYGSLFDPLSIARGTMTIAPLIEADGIKQNDQPNYDLRRSVALSLRDYSPRRFAATEVDGNWHDLSEQIYQIEEFYRVGGSMACIHQIYPPGKGAAEAKPRIAGILTPSIVASLNAPVANNYQATYTVDWGRLVNDTWMNGQKQAFPEFNAASDNGSKRVRIVIKK
ncbi:beta-galactosidase [Fibrella sp. ES10-3-2-2]|nr:hypothetical protein A6C57_23485 [Fibrella sp. ES10-3-2-2]